MTNIMRSRQILINYIEPESLFSDFQKAQVDWRNTSNSAQLLIAVPLIS